MRARMQSVMLFQCLFLLLHFLYPSPASAASDVALLHCPQTCGRVTIPYPFGTAAGCYRDPSFHITCNTTSRPPKPFITTATADLEVVSLSVDDATAVVRAPILRHCGGDDEFITPGGGLPVPKFTLTDVTGLPFTFSNTRNRLTAVGCDIAVLGSSRDGASANDFSTGCMSFCGDGASDVANGTCRGIGCCQTAIPRGLKRFVAALTPAPGIVLNRSRSNVTPPCSYAFLIDQDQFVFDSRDLYDDGPFGKRQVAVAVAVPVVLDWAIEKETCATAKNLACGPNSHCSDSANGRGYRCSCNTGYRGNPYFLRGCQDVDECEDPTTSPCAQICTNTPGSYLCSCRRGFYGDGLKLGNGCIKLTTKFPVLQVALGSGLGLLLMLFSGSWIHWGLKKRKLMKLKEYYFKKNGGLFLQQQISSKEGETARIFTAVELAQATNNYNENRVLGQGGFGTVYKGILPDDSVVAIKKSRIVDDEAQIEQFINEVVILSQVSHRNVVRMLGCCLETRVPLLVYEYISNGTLDHHIHHRDRKGSLSWETRLRIAAETAGALAYLHTKTARPIFHRDVKSANILLDDNYMAKVADFGVSRVIPLDRDQITTLVQGTMGYLDPEYFRMGQLTEKSDVYSFGVVLAELLTGEKPLPDAIVEEGQNLAIYFLLNVRRNRLFEILEARVRNEGSREQLVAVGEVTSSCLRMRGEERPTMSEVAMELQQLRRRSVSQVVVEEEDTEEVEDEEVEDDERILDCSPSESTMYFTSQMSSRD